jgi:hypothetical protein
LTGVGTTSKSDLNVGTMIAPRPGGEVTVLGEASRRLPHRAGSGRALRRLFHPVELRSAHSIERAILEAAATNRKQMFPIRYSIV